MNRIVTLFASAGVVAGAGLGCSSSSSSNGSGGTPLRPGVEDSSQVYKGTPSANESAFWVAVRNADDAGRADAVNKMIADVQKDPTNGYSEFLIAASMFMPSNDLLRALANGTQPQPPAMGANSDTVKYLQEGMSNLTDPLYLGFDAAFLGLLELSSGDQMNGAKTFAFAQSKNHAASGFISIFGERALGGRARSQETRPSVKS